MELNGTFFCHIREVSNSGGSCFPSASISADGKSGVDVVADSRGPKMSHCADTRLLAVLYDC